MNGFSSTAPDPVNPFADTDPRAISYEHVAAVLERARKRRKATPEPLSYWEDPWMHGSGRQVSLRPKASTKLPARSRRSAPIKLPPRPRADGVTSGQLAFVGIVAGAAVLGWWLYKRSKQGKIQSTHRVGDSSGFDVLGEA